MCKKKLASFTLIELLATVTVISLVLGGVLYSITNSIALDEYNQELSIVVNIARAKIEETLSQKSDFNNIVSTTGPLTISTNGIKGAYRIDITDVVNNELKNIRVAVCWQSRGGRIFGDCEAEGDHLKWKINGTNSPCVLVTALAKR